MGLPVPYFERDGVTLYHADCRDILPSLPKVDLVLTDPPYGIDCTKTGCGEVGRKGFNYGGDFTQTDGAIIEGDLTADGSWVPMAFDLLTDNSACYSFSRWDVDHLWRQFFVDAGFVLKNRIVWHKANHGSGDLEGAFGFSHETIWRAVKGRSLLRCKRVGDVWQDGWTECVRHGKVHPFEKPLDLIKRLIEADSEYGDTTLDPFAGSGTTLRAAMDLGRKAVGIEISERYCEIAARRLEQRNLQFAESL